MVKVLAAGSFRTLVTRLRTSYGDEKYDRLVAVKDADDPGNVFALNPNIAPDAASLRSADVAHALAAGVVGLGSLLPVLRLAALARCRGRGRA